MYCRSEGGLCSASPSFWRKCCCAQHNALQYSRVLGCVAIGRQRLNAAVSRPLNAMHTNATTRAGNHCHPPPPHRTHTHAHTPARWPGASSGAVSTKSLSAPLLFRPPPAPPLPCRSGEVLGPYVSAFCAPICVATRRTCPSAPVRRSAERSVAWYEAVCVCVAEWLELGQAPGYECGCCSMVLCGPAVAVCRVEGPGRVQSAHTSGRPSAGPYSLRVFCCRPRTLNREITGGGGAI